MPVFTTGLAHAALKHGTPTAPLDAKIIKLELKRCSLAKKTNNNFDHSPNANLFHNFN